MMFDDVLLEAKEKCSSFFGFVIDDIDVVIVHSRDEINRLKGYDTPDWIVGWTDKSSRVFVLSEDKFELESCHKKKEFRKVLIHEIAHLYTRRILKSRIPLWLHEGLAMFLAGQVNLSVSRDESKKALDFFDVISKDMYQYSGAFVFYLLEDYGKAKVLELARGIGDHMIREEFDILFNKIFS